MQDGETNMIGMSENSVLAFHAFSRRDMANTRAASGDVTQHIVVIYCMICHKIKIL